MNFLPIVSGAILGTSLMTLFSYVASHVRNKQFREPELLNKLLVRARIMKFTSSKNHPAGWLIHYSVGVFFVTAYQLIVQTTSVAPTVLFYILLGFVSGIIGVIVWHTTFRVHPNPPVIALKEFYTQLLAAHVIFGTGAWLGLHIWQ